MRCCTHSLLFRGSLGVARGGGQQQFVTQTLRVHLLGIEKIRVRVAPLQNEIAPKRFEVQTKTRLGVSEMASAKMASTIGVRIDDMGSILKFRIGFPFGENSARFCQSVWLPGSILNFRIGSISSIGGLIAATLFADTVSDS